MAGLVGISSAAGLLQCAVFQAISLLYINDRAAAVNLAGALLGGGCLAMALLVSGTFYVYTVPSILIMVAAIPGLFAAAYAGMRYPIQPCLNMFRTWKDSSRCVLRLRFCWRSWCFSGSETNGLWPAGCRCS